MPRLTGKTPPLPEKAGFPELISVGPRIIVHACNPSRGLLELLDFLDLAEIDIPLDNGEFCDAHVLHERLCGELRRVDCAKDVPPHLVCRHLPSLVGGEH